MNLLGRPWGTSLRDRGGGPVRREEDRRHGDHRYSVSLCSGVGIGTLHLHDLLAAPRVARNRAGGGAASSTRCVAPGWFGVVSDAGQYQVE